jgi:hypothetical protein
MSKKGLGISKLEIALMLPGIRKRLKKTIDKSGAVDLGSGMRTVGYVFHKLKRAARKPYKNLLEKQAIAFDSLANLIDIGGQKMAKKFELGITMGEITAMLPGILSEAWGHYSDDKKISVDEGIALVAFILNNMASAADDEDVADFFSAEAAALTSLTPFFEEEEEEEPPVE